ncbi:hypothetical protein Q8F55_004258 [Vanrija albida]|uniref:Uncharacterized protein n=1 Tax=Vanrija albida TaxID=181172 RepID=A0ABR3Q6W6_9TREE
MDVDSPRPGSPPTPTLQQPTSQYRPVSPLPARARSPSRTPSTASSSQGTLPARNGTSDTVDANSQNKHSPTPNGNGTLAPPPATATPAPAASEDIEIMQDGEQEQEPEHEQEHDGTSSSSGASIGPASAASGRGAPAAEVHVAGPDDAPEDMDRFLRRVEMEKKIAQLQQRLELASFKTNHGWTDMSIGEIENRLPSPRAPSRPQLVIPRGHGPQYEPPSPSRPWQLADVLWQSLPQPGGNHMSPPQRDRFTHHGPTQSLPGGLPSLASITGIAPRGPQHPNPRRHRMDDYLSGPTLSPMRGPMGNGGPPRAGGSHGHQGGHRRASSSVSSLQFLAKDPYPASPLRPKKGTKKRSQSHSNLRERPSTQDVDAAKALTFMLGSGRSPVASTDRPLPRGDGPLLPPIQSAASLPPPFSPDMPPPRPRAQSFAVPEFPRDARGGDGRDYRDQRDSRPLGPPPPSLPPPAGLRTPSSHTRNRGASMDSSAAFRGGGGGWWEARQPEADSRSNRPVDRERDLSFHAHSRTPSGAQSRGHSRNNSRDIERITEPEEMAGRGEEDKNAVELMMFLAHSPSPARKRQASDGQLSFGGTARVLFSESEGGGGSNGASRGPPPNGLPPPPLSARALRESSGA